MRRTLFLVGILIEVVLVFLVFLPYMLIVANGQTVILKTLPVDPRSIFRGDYVVLSYEIGQEYDGPTMGELVHGVKPVYVLLEKRGEVHEQIGFSENVPTLEQGQACVRGEAMFNGQWSPDGMEQTVVTVRFPDIEQYFIEEGAGLELEQAQNAKRLYVDIATTERCKAVIKVVRIGEEVQPEVEVELDEASASTER